MLTPDVLIIGGGLVGGALACALGRGGMDVVVIDRGDPLAAVAPTFDGRASAIAQASKRVFDGLGLWSALDDVAAPIEDIRVTDGNSPLFLHFDHHDIGDQPLGYMLENRAIRQALHQAIANLPTVHLLAPAVVTALQRGPGMVHAALADGRTVVAPLAIAADGRHSWTRDSADIKVTGWTYGQTGIVCTVAHERPHDFIAHEHFLSAGPFAILPLQGNRSSIVWTEREELAPAIMALDDTDFLAELARRFGDFLGTLEIVGPRWAYPLSLQYAQTAIAPRLALVGDAAHAMHPIAGQGLNMGLRDVAALAEVLVDTRRLGLDIGDSGVLERYQRWRRFDNTLMLAMTDGLNRLFSNRIRPLRLARDIGLAAVNHLGPVKNILARQAMGLAGDAPRLMRGEPL